MSFDSHSIAPNEEHYSTDVIVAHVAFDANKVLVSSKFEGLHLPNHSLTLNGQYEVVLSIIEVDCFQILLLSTDCHLDHFDLSVRGDHERLLAREAIAELQ